MWRTQGNIGENRTVGKNGDSGENGELWKRNKIWGDGLVREHEKLRERIVAKTEYCGKEQRPMGKKREWWETGNCEKGVWGRAG